VRTHGNELDGPGSMSTRGVPQPEEEFYGRIATQCLALPVVDMGTRSLFRGNRPRSISLAIVSWTLVFIVCSAADRLSGCDPRCSGCVCISSLPIYNRLQGEERFTALVQKIGLGK
jgi:hypothetical protein